MGSEQRQSGSGVWGAQCNQNDPPAKRILWGVFLIVVGGLLLSARIGYLDIPNIWKLWPIGLIAVGAGNVLERRLGAALGMTLLGLSFFAAEFRWMGLSYRTFWPLLLIAVGAGLVVRAITREDDGRARKGA